MIKFLNKLEQKFGKYSIKNLPLVIIIMYAVGYIMSLINPQVIFWLELNPGAILKGQVWRLVTWLLIPPDTTNLFFLLIMLFFYYSISRTLVNVWGAFYFNLYIFMGMFFTVLCAFGYYVYIGFGLGINPDILTNWLAFSTYYINMSIFLAYAATFPNAVVYLFFVLPIKVKWLGIIYGILIVVNSLSKGLGGVILPFASLLNFIIFFICTRSKFRGRNIRIIKAKPASRVSKSPNVNIAVHKCAICGKTDETDPDLEFRFCSKCNGNYQYCQNHLFTHKHVK